MEEERDLGGLRIGGNKQGLGFRSSPTSVPKSETHGVLSNFVKEKNVYDTAALHREIRIENIRDKLKRRDIKLAREKSSGPRSPSNRSRSPQRTKRVEAKERGRETPDSASGDRRRHESSPRSRSSSSERTQRVPLKESRRKEGKRRSPKEGTCSPDRRSSSSERTEKSLANRSSGKEGRSTRAEGGELSRSPIRGNGEKISRSPSVDSGKVGGKPRTGGRESRTKKHQKRERSSSDSLSSDTSGKSFERNRKKKRRDRNISPTDDKGYGHSSKRGSARSRRSASKSVSPTLHKSGSRSRRDGSASPARLDSRSRSRRNKSISPARRSSRSRSRISPARRTGASRSRRDKSFSPTRYERHSRSRRDRSISPIDSSRRRSQNSSARRRRSSSRSYEERITRNRSRSRSVGRHTDRRGDYRRDRVYHSTYSRTGRRSRSPSSYRSSYNHRDSGQTRRSEGRYLDGGRKKYEDGRSTDKSSDIVQHKETKEKLPERDYSKLIPNFDNMTPAEKVKAKMKLQLSETVVKDKAMGMSDEWERFDFNKNAPLDDDAKLDYFGGLGQKLFSILFKAAYQTMLIQELITINLFLSELLVSVIGLTLLTCPTGNGIAEPRPTKN